MKNDVMNKQRAIDHYLRIRPMMIGLNGVIICVMARYECIVSPDEVDGVGEYYKMIEDASGGVDAIRLDDLKYMQWLL